MRYERGFLVVEMLIAGAILTASIAATMYLFKIGAENLERVNNSNLLSSKLPQAVSLVRELDLEPQQGSEDLGDGVALTWTSKLVDRLRPAGQAGAGAHEIYLHRVDFILEYRDRLEREYGIYVFRYKALQSPAESLF